jgi:hypothetical protein
MRGVEDVPERVAAQAPISAFRELQLAASFFAGFVKNKCRGRANEA